MRIRHADGHHSLMDFSGASGATEGEAMNVFIVEDSAIMLKNLRSMLSDISGVTVIGHADGADAIECIGALLPDLVILDISLRNIAGIGMLENIKKRHPGIKVMILTGCTDEFYSSRCKRAGADYFFDKVFQLTRVRAALWQWVYANRLDNRFEALQIPGFDACCNNSMAVKF